MMTGKVEAPMLNEKIPYRSVQLITADGKNLGTVSRDDALRMAREAGLDLVILSDKDTGVPVAKIMDYGKASYAKKKQLATAKKKQHVILIKEVQLGPKIGEHDFRTKLNSVVRFLSDGNHVKIVITFRGREAAIRDQRGAEMFSVIDSFLAEYYNDKVTYDKNVKTNTTWMRIYSTK